MAECRNCGANPQKESVCLVRVNPLGEDGVFECTPSCHLEMSDEGNLLLAMMLDILTDIDLDDIV